MRPAGIAYTSGTTGRPKGIVHSQHNLLLPGAVLVASRGWGPSLRKGDCLPLTILNMLVLTTLLTAQAGGCCIVMDRRDAEGVAEWVGRERIGVWNGAPAQLYDLARHPELDLTALTEVWSGGGDCSDQLRDAFHSTHGLAHPGAPTASPRRPPSWRSIRSASEWRRGASGRVLPHLQVTACDDDGATLAPGAEGELRLQARDVRTVGGRVDADARGTGRTVGCGLHADSESATGDIGSVDAEGWLQRGRAARSSSSCAAAQTSIRPRWSECSPPVREFAAAAVFGVPDERLGERVAALVAAARDGRRPRRAARGLRAGTRPLQGA